MPTTTTLPTTTTTYSPINTKNLSGQISGIGLKIALIVILAISVLMFAWLVGTWLRRGFRYVSLRRRLINNSVHYELIPLGERPEDRQVMTQQFSQAIGLLGQSRNARLSVYRWRDGTVVHSGITISGITKGSPGGIATQIARAVGAEARPIPVCPIPDVPYLAYASRTGLIPTSNALSSIASGKQMETATLANALTDVLSSGIGNGFILACFDPASTRERNALIGYATRFSARTAAVTGAGATHPWLESRGSLCRGVIYAGADDLETAQTLVNIGPMLPHYESTLKSQKVTDRWPSGQYMLLGLIMGGALALVSYFATKHGSLVKVGMIGAAISLGAYLVSSSNILKLSEKAAWGWLQHGLGPVPPRPLLSWKRGIHGGTQRAGNEVMIKSEWHPHRSIRRLLVLTAEQAAVVAALPPTTSTMAQTTGARSVTAPVEVRSAPGARLGYDADGWGCQVPDANRTGGLIVIGDPGHGKSSLLLSVFGSDLLRRSRKYAQTGEVKQCGIWLETKGEGASRTLAIASQVGYSQESICFVDVTSVNGVQLDLIDENDPFGSAEALAEAMRYAFPARSIMDDSEETLKLTLALAITMPREVLISAGEDPEQGIMSITHKLIGGDPVTGASERILTAVSNYLGMAEEPTQEDGGWDSEVAGGEEDPIRADIRLATPLAIAYRGYQSKIRSKKADTESVFSAPRNKVSKLLVAESLWRNTPGRPKVSFRQMLEKKMVVVINFGGERSFPDELRARLGALTTYLLWQSIKQTCDNWDFHGNSVTIYADELADVAGAGGDAEADAVRLMFDGGRSRGVWPTFATQRLAQIPDSTRSAALSSNAKVYLRQENHTEAEAAVLDLVGKDSLTFVEDDIRRLPKMNGIARMHVGDDLPGAFTLHVVPDKYISPEYLDASVISNSPPPPSQGGM